MAISAVIFDLDGTVIDSEGQWAEAFRKVLKKLKAKIDEKHPQIGGIGVEANWRLLSKKYNLDPGVSIDQLTSETNQEFIKLIPEIQISPGFMEFIEGVKENGVLTALATSTEWYIVEKVFDRLPLGDLFDSVTTGEEVINKKPEPDIFLKAANKLGVKAQECLVIEDAASGVKAARLAGMKVIGIATGEGDLVVKSFSALSPRVLASLGF